MISRVKSASPTDTPPEETIASAQPAAVRIAVAAETASSYNALRGCEAVVLRTEAVHAPYAEFQRSIGDQRARLLVYPSVWLLDAHSGLPLMQMPAGAGTFQTVPEQLEILRLEQ